MRLYETVIVFDPQLKAPEIEESLKKFTNFIVNHGGEIAIQEEWGKRRLAYEIKRRQYGFYILLRFNGPGQLVALLEREFKLNEMVLRHLTIKLDKKALQVEQALEQEKAEEAPKKEPESEEKAPENVTLVEETDSETEPEPEIEPAEELPEESAIIEEKRDN